MDTVAEKFSLLVLMIKDGLGVQLSFYNVLMPMCHSSHSLLLGDLLISYGHSHTCIRDCQTAENVKYKINTSSVNPNI